MTLANSLTTNLKQSPEARAKAELELRRRRGELHRPTIDYADLRILDKRNRIVPLTLKRAQKELLASLTGRDLVLKARQVGISTVVQGKFYIDANKSSQRIAVLAHDNEGTQKLRDMHMMFHDQLPPDLQPQRTQNNVTRTYYPQTGSRFYMNTAGSAQGGRAGTYTRVHGSEVAFWKDAAAIMAGLLQGVPNDGEIILESTPNGQQGWFYEHCMAALAGDSEWALHFFPWWYDDEYRLPVNEPMTLTGEEQRLVELHGLDHEQIAWRRLKVRQLGSKFPQEYPEDVHSAFIASGQGYFILRSEMFDAPIDATPQEGNLYVAGLDFGQSNDYTVLSIIDATVGEQVYLLRINRMPWAEMRRQVIDACLAWNVQLLVPEANSMGTTNIEALTTEMYAAGCATNILAFHTTLTSKTTLLATLRQALEERDLTLTPDPVQRREMSAFTSRQTATGVWQLSAPEGEHDDTVIATGLAWHGAGQMLTPGLNIDLSIQW